MLGLSLAAMTTAAHATDDAFEVWLNPSIEYDLSKHDSIELETAQRFRSASEGRADTYFVWAWLHHDLNETFTLSGALEQRENDGGFDEVHMIQQLSGKHGYIRTRVRLEERWVEDQSRMGFRIRPRLGVVVPINDNGD